MARVCILLMLGLGLLPACVWARVDMAVDLGLQGTVRLERWNPVTVSLHNSAEALQGEVGVRVWRGSEYRKDLHVTTMTRSVQLPHRARKRFTFSIPIASVTHPIEIFFRSHGNVIAEQQLNLREALSAEHIIVGLSRDLGLDFLATAFQRHTRVAYLRVPELPRVWSGYDSVTAVVVKGVSLQRATAAQWRALHQWVLRGGILVVAGDSQYALLQEPRMRQLLPVEVLGLEEVHGLPALASHYGVPVPDVPLVQLRAWLTAGEVLVGTPEAPLLAQRSLGHGRVVFLAADYAAQPLDTWPGQKALWNDILQPSDQVDYGRVFAELGLLDDSHPMMKLLSRPILNYPSHTLLSMILIAYCSSLALIFWWMRRRGGGRRRGWVSVAATVAVASVSAYVFCQERGLRETALLYDLSVMEVFYQNQNQNRNRKHPASANDLYARARGHLGVFSPRGGDLALTFQRPDTILRHTFHRGMGKGYERLNLRLEAETVLDGIKLDPWALRVMSVDSMVPAPLHVQAERHATGITIRVKNRGSVPLQGAAVLYRGRLFALGSIAPDTELFEDLYVSLQSSESQYETAWQALYKARGSRTGKSARYLQEVLLQHYFGEAHLSQVSQTPLLIGWLPAPATLVPAAGTPTIRGMTLVVGYLAPQNL
ncbi:hypothetical protein [Candidatus Entotheonella palauensis]|uniref:hypothetical protein n=1 Tax=Candidatus Entotheonella palauensis TaxID=93172 RepID=UPI0011774D97|nr:hypothetical protein [Candidatus Entotheonella palauensis]